MKLLHTADTHLGYTAYNRLDENGMNQRETDVYNAFQRVIDLAISEKVYAVLHSGDLFDSVRPSNRAISFALEQIRRLEDAGIPFAAISGNHSTPRLRETGSVFSILSVLSNVKAAYRGRYERLDIDDLRIHALPHCPTNEAFRDELKSLSPCGSGYEVAMLHAGVIGVDVFRMGEVNENTCPVGPLVQEGFGYVALGHYHRHTEVARNVVYAGSLERLSFAEAGDRKGCVIVDISQGDWRFVDMPTRKMVDIHLQWDGGTPGELEKMVCSAVEERDIVGAAVRLTVDSLPRSVQRGADMKKLAALGHDALVFQQRFISREEEQSMSGGDAKIRSLGLEFQEFISDYRLEDMDRERMTSLGKEYIDKAGGSG